MLKIALLGCGEHSSLYHATSLGQLAKERPGQVQLAAAVDLNLDRAAAICQEHGFRKPYADYRQMLEIEKPDAVVAVMPVPIVAKIGEELLTRKIPCVIEKPIGANINEARRLVDVARQTGTIHMVSTNRRFSPPLNKAKAWCAQQGKLRFLRGNMLRVNRTEPDFAWGTGLHLVDGIRYAAGDVAELTLKTTGGTAEHPTVWYAASLTFTSGAQGSFEIQTTTGIPEETYDFLGDNFRAKAVVQQSGETSIKCWKSGKVVLEESTNPNEAPWVSRGEYAETTEFIEALSAKRQPHPSLEDILPSAEICHRLMTRK